MHDNLQKLDQTVVPAWWDPKNRKMIINPDTIVCGMLIVGAGRIVLAGPDGIAFDLSTAGLGVTWVKMGTACRLRTAQKTYLVYLMPPVDGAPQLSHSALAGIADALTTTGDLGDLGELLHKAGLLGDLGLLGEIAEKAGVTGQSMKTLTALAGMRHARHRRRAIEDQLARTT